MAHLKAFMRYHLSLKKNVINLINSLPKNNFYFFHYMYIGSCCYLACWFYFDYKLGKFGTDIKENILII